MRLVVESFSQNDLNRSRTRELYRLAIKLCACVILLYNIILLYILRIHFCHYHYRYPSTFTINSWQLQYNDNIF